ncbi:MAG: S9 family peptidase [Acidobacteria bacterium]|nr:S9 family peptidase [Acidobacteriota bacterium]
MCPRLFAALILLVPMSVPAQKIPFTAVEMMKLKRISEPSLAPDGSAVVYTVGEVDVEKNAQARQLWMSPVSGGAPRQVTTEGRNTSARFSPDAKKIAWISTKGGSAQVWVMDALGTNPKQITKLSTEADGVIWSGDGAKLVFTSEVYPECNADDACNQKKLDAEAKSKVKARTYTSLLYRHWTEWKSKRVKHLMAVSADGGAVKDLTPGFKYDVPPFSFGGGNYTVSADGKEVCYAANLEADQAMSTNWELYTVPIDGPADGKEAVKVSNSPGADASPAYSPDGKWLAWRMQVRAGYESDRWRLVVLERETGKLNVLTENLDRHVTGFAWHPDSKRLAFTVEDRGRQQAQMIAVTGGGTRALTQGSTHVDDLQFANDGKTLLYTEVTGASPTEIYKASSGGGAPVALTKLNEKFLAEHDVRRLEEFTVTGAEGAQVHSFLLKPPAFDAKKKYPVLFLIHGGPQGAWGESFSYRWNQQVFATAGFVVVMPNPRGSTGYGSKFTDEINGDWGGKAYDDIMAVADHVEKLPYVDGERMAAAGGSYGGYMVNWIMGHTQRFKALVSHAGVYDLPSMGGETEELWFSTWEFKGFPWQNPEMYEKWSPSKHVANFKTPTLVIHGELDFRVPYGQGLQLFTGLQAQKVPSKLLVYPDEGHWVLKPQNSLLWYDTFLEWVGEWTKKKSE